MESGRWVSGSVVSGFNKTRLIMQYINVPLFAVALVFLLLVVVALFIVALF